MWHEAIMGACCCQLSECSTSLCTEDLCLFLTQGCTGLWGDQALTCTSLLSCNKVKKVGWLQVAWNKASSSLYWSLGRRRHVPVCRLEKPQVSLLCTADISSVSAGVTSKATGSATLSQRNKSYRWLQSHRATKLNIRFPFLIEGQKLGSPPPSKIPSPQADCAGAGSWCA